MEEELIQLVNNAENENDKVTALINLVVYYGTTNDISSQFKYAAIASVCTRIPRADVCCLLGTLYEKIGNGIWAIKWYENAISNASSCDIAFYTWYPMLRMANLYADGNPEMSKNYLNAAKIICPNFLEKREEIPF